MTAYNDKRELHLGAIARLFCGEDPDGKTTPDPVRNVELLLVQSVDKGFLSAYLKGELIGKLRRTDGGGSYTGGTIILGGGIKPDEWVSHKAIELSDIIVRQDDFLEFVSDNPCYWKNDPGIRPYVCGNALLGWTSQMYAHGEVYCQTCEQGQSCQYAPPEKPCVKCEYTVIRAKYATNRFWDTPDGVDGEGGNVPDNDVLDRKAEPTQKGFSVSAKSGAEAFKLSVEARIKGLLDANPDVKTSNIVSALEELTGGRDKTFMTLDPQTRSKKFLGKWICDIKREKGLAVKRGRPRS